MKNGCISILVIRHDRVDEKCPIVGKKNQIEVKGDLDVRNANRNPLGTSCFHHHVTALHDISCCKFACDIC